jgi:hypothetical protein
MAVLMSGDRRLPTAISGEGNSGAVPGESRKKVAESVKVYDNWARKSAGNPRQGLENLES